MTKTLIKIHNLSKFYRLGSKEKHNRTLTGYLTQIIKSPIENFIRLRNLNKFNEENDSVFWALKDVSFQVEEGVVLGIIGKNGAGKSTLLKILSQITEPSSGKIEIHGRVASLLEVGTGFHPELSGRENIYMNGTILGMTRKEIDTKLDEIIDFSGVEKFIDTPVKFYSSGMKVRLGFSVAAHLDPEILIIDEVLAVGDYEFQKKCLGKMEDVSKNHGRTVLFVSHDLDAVSRICKKLILLENGIMTYQGNIKEGLLIYKPYQKFCSNLSWNGCVKDYYLDILGVTIISSNNDQIYNEDEITVSIKIFNYKKIESPVLGFNIYSDFGFPIARFNYNDFNLSVDLKFGLNIIDFVIPKFFLAPGRYSVKFDIAIPYLRKLSNEEMDLYFEVSSKGLIGNAFDVTDDPKFNSLIRSNLVSINFRYE